MTTKAITGPPLAMAAVSLGLLIATAVSSSENKYTGLYALLSVSLFFSAISAGWEWRLGKSRNEKLSSAIDIPMAPTLKWLVMVPSVSLFILLLVRLLCVGHFSTDPAALDFGDKHGNPDEPNLSFRGGSDWGHWGQGFVATLCAYAASAVVAAPGQWNARAGGKIYVKLEAASYAGTVYPVYNGVKRFLQTPETFATSSYTSNGCEWALGSWVGIACGMLVMACAKQRKLKQPQDDDDEERRGYHNASSSSQGSDNPSTAKNSVALFWANFVLFLTRTIGTLFCVSVMCASVLTGLTWNNCSDGGTECGNYGEDQQPIGITVGLATIPLMVAACGMALGRAW